MKIPRYRYQEEFKTYELDTKIRPICFAAHVDSLIFSYYAYALTKVYESFINKEGFSQCVLAYRSNLGGQSNIQFAKEVFDYIKEKKECTAVALDIKGYFDHIDHVILKENWQKVVGGPLPEDQYKIYKLLTRYSYINQSSILKKYKVDLRALKKENKYLNTLLDVVPGTKDYEKFNQLRTNRIIVTNNIPDKKTGRYNGIPQGSALSALLSNVYLIEFDKLLCAKSQEEGFLYRRYCDDIIVVCNTSKAKELQCYIVDLILNKFYLTIQSEKVDITDFFVNSKEYIRAFSRKKIEKLKISAVTGANEKRAYKPLQYLGFEFDGQNIRLRSSSLSRYFRKMKARLDKTVHMAYSPNAKSDRIFKKQIFERYTHLGRRNFLSYAYKASLREFTNGDKMTKPGMNSPAIRKQLQRHFSVLMNSLAAKNIRRFNHKLKANRDKKLMRL
jgi:RNA-directed DNA polymerase